MTPYLDQLAKMVAAGDALARASEACVRSESTPTDFERQQLIVALAFYYEAQVKLKELEPK